MGAWFSAGGLGMLLVAAVGLAAIFVGASVLAGTPSEGRLSFLRAAPGLLASLATFAVGLNLWAVYGYLSAHPADVGTGMVGMLEAAQPLTLAGPLVAIAIALRLVAEGRAKRS